MLDNPPVPRPPAPGPRSTRRRVLGRLTRAITWGSIALLSAWNGWCACADRAAENPAAVDARIARGQNDEAERALRLRLRLAPEDGEARMKLARLLALKDDRIGCAGELHQVPTWSPRKAEALFMEGQVCKILNRAQDAEPAWKALIADDPLHPVPKRYSHGAARDLIILYVVERRLAEIREVLGRVYDLSDPPERPGILLQRIRAELELVAHAEAAAKLRQYVEADPGDWDARRALAFEEHALGDPAAADRDFRACLEARPDDVATWRDWIKVLSERGDTEAIRAGADKFPPGADRDASLQVARGNVRLLDGDTPGAAIAFREAIRIDPHQPEAYYKLAQAEQILGETEAAKSHRDRSRELYKSLGELRTAYEAVLNASQKSDRERAPYEVAVRKLSGICRDLGWVKEADAWLRVLSGA